jgi:NADPH2:quinone reductase
VIGYDEVADTVRTLTDGLGLPAVFDGVGKDTFDTSLASLRRRGMMVLFGASSGPVPPVDPQRLNSGGSLFLTRPTLGDYLATRDELLWRAGDLFAAVVDGSLTVRIGATFPLEQARQAHEALEGRRTTGKVLLLP